MFPIVERKMFRLVLILSKGGPRKTRPNLKKKSFQFQSFFFCLLKLTSVLKTKKDSGRSVIIAAEMQPWTEGKRLLLAFDRVFETGHCDFSHAI